MLKSSGTRRVSKVYYGGKIYAVRVSKNPDRDEKVALSQGILTGRRGDYLVCDWYHGVTPDIGDSFQIGQMYSSLPSINLDCSEFDFFSFRDELYSYLHYHQIIESSKEIVDFESKKSSSKPCGLSRLC